jgi:hypothetical protein
MRTRSLASCLAVLFMLTAWFPFTGVAAAQPFAVTASVLLCQVDPASGTDLAHDPDNCAVEVEGADITVTVEGEGILGSCVTDSQVTPNGGILNACSIDGAEFNQTLTFELDESTIPAGFVIEENPITFEIGDEIPGGGESTTVTFRGWLENPPELQESPSDETPKIGFNADILGGTCDDPEPNVAILNAVEVETGTAVGLETAIRPEVSHTTVEIDLDELIDVPHSIAVYGVNEFAGDRILCGEIGGVDNDDGVLHIGLRDIAGTGASGVASLSYNADNAEHTDITIFVIPPA